MIADMFSEKEINIIVNKLLVRARKQSISLVFVTQSYFTFPENIKLNSSHYFITKIPKKENFKKLHLIIQQILNLKTL